MLHRVQDAVQDILGHFEGLAIPPINNGQLVEHHTGFMEKAPVFPISYHSVIDLNKEIGVSSCSRCSAQPIVVAYVSAAIHQPRWYEVGLIFDLNGDCLNDTEIILCSSKYFHKNG